MTALHDRAPQFLEEIALPDELLQALEIVGTRPGGLVEAMVPVELISREDVPVDQAHVNELRASMLDTSQQRGGTGQLSPILVGWVSGLPKLRIIDGFHRDAALFEEGAQNIYCTVRPCNTIEEVEDLRILTANMHSSVNFARTVDWVQSAWNKTTWADKMTAAQAFAMVSSGSSGKIIGLSPDESAAVKQWVQDKCELWRKAPATIRADLVTAADADPELVKAARRRVGGHQLNHVTPQHLQVIALGLPGRFAEQRLVAEIAVKNNFNIPSTRAVVQALKTTKDFAEADHLASTTIWEKLEPVYAETKTRQLKKQANQELAASMQYTRELLVSEVMLARASIENYVLRGRYNAVPEQVTMGKVPLVIDVNPGTALQKELVTSNSAQMWEMLDERLEQITDPLVVGIQRAYPQVNAETARKLLQIANDLICNDIEQGVLRFVPFDRLSQLDSIINNTMRSLVTINDLHRAQNLVRPSDKLAVHVAAGTVLKVIPEISRADRQALFLHGFLGANIDLIARVLNLRPQEVKTQLTKSFKIIDSVKALPTAVA